MNVVINSNESLVFRDGRPFGSEGQYSGGALRWPHAVTITGLLRSRIGISRSPDYFTGPNQEANIRDIKKVTATRVIPLWQGAAAENEEWQPLFPAPADAMIFSASQQNQYVIKGVTYQNAFDQGGIDLPWKNWRLPVSNIREKPASDSPDLWYRNHFFTWLETSAIDTTVCARDLGISYPRLEIRMHTAIDPKSGSAKTGQLFSSQGIQLQTAESDRQPAGRLGIGVSLAHLEKQDNPCGPCFLGGERKTAWVAPIDEVMPPLPDWLNISSRYLRLVLISPGDFGDWAPGWLLPDWKLSETAWCSIPGTSLAVRLVSAFIPRWHPVSGWDYDRRGPKATRKLVPAGAVYVIELKEPKQAPEVAKLLWGRSINTDLCDPNGSGCVCVGKLTI